MRKIIVIAAVAMLMEVTTAQHGDISLPFFTGLCRYGSNDVDSLGTFSNINANACRQKCKGTNGCTAFAVDSVLSCVLYRGGPYTKGDGYSGITCYIMYIASTSTKTISTITATSTTKMTTHPTGAPTTTPKQTNLSGGEEDDDD